MATGSETKIDTKLFASTADTLGGVAKQMDGYCQEWNKTMGTLRNVWQGDTSDNIKNTAEQVQKSAAELVRARYWRSRAFTKRPSRACRKRENP